MTRASWIAAYLGGALLLAHGQQVTQQLTPEERTVAELASSFVDAYNNGEAKALASMFAADAEWIADDATVTKGRDGIEELFRKIFSENNGRKPDLAVESARALTPEMLVERGVSTVVDKDGTTNAGSYSAVHVKKNGHWLIAQLTEMAAPPAGGTAAQLQALAWLVGSWVEKSPSVEVRETVKWTANRTFLTRSYTLKRPDVETAQGTEVIGWDPAIEKVRSWAFDSDGGFSESTWTRDGNRWLILVKATLPDGRQGTAQHTLTYVNIDMHTWSSASRQVADELLPNIDPIEIVQSRQLLQQSLC